MQILMVVDNPANWALSVRAVEVISSRTYLTDPSFNTLRDVRLFNLCRSYSYQSLGYYVSLLAEARGHRPQPDITTIQDMKSASLTRLITEDLDDLIQKVLRPVRPDKFVLSIYFGRTVAKRDQRLGRRLFGLFRSPLLRAQFRRRKKWHLQSIRPIPASEIPETHRPIVIAAAESFFAKRRLDVRHSYLPRYYLAILHDPAEEEPPSDEAALRKFIRAARRLEISADLITSDDFGRLGEYDALFIRTTTAINHYTYRFARRAAADGLAVIDDPVSIARCTNKVYLTERMLLSKIPILPSVVVHRGNAKGIIDELGLPLILKQPDSSFSRGVIKVEDPRTLRERIDELLEKSDLIIAQTFTPTEFDWRVGVLDGQPLFVCKYFMARYHWQIVKNHPAGKAWYGKVETLSVEDAPRRVVSLATRAARSIGDGLYGVDLKQVGNKVYVMEVNDNPNIESGYEDRILKDELYERVIESFVRRIERLRQGARKRVR